MRARRDRYWALAATMPLDEIEHIGNILQSKIADQLPRLQREASVRCGFLASSAASAQRIAALPAPDRMPGRD